MSHLNFQGPVQCIIDHQTGPTITPFIDVLGAAQNTFLFKRCTPELLQRWRQVEKKYYVAPRPTGQTITLLIDVLGASSCLRPWGSFLIQYLKQQGVLCDTEYIDKRCDGLTSLTLDDVLHKYQRTSGATYHFFSTCLHP
jgi:hypothetical protein